MLPVVTSLLALVSLAALGHAAEWAPNDMYIPWRNWQDCNLDTTSEKSPRYMVCDPDKILRRNEVNQINWLLRDAAHNSSCPCSNRFCEDNVKKLATGYHIGVALIKKMKLQDDVITGKRNNPRDQAMLFARSLEKDRWAMGNCEDDIIVFYSMADQELAIHVGRTAAGKLTSDARLRLMQFSNHHFADGRIIEGISTLLHNMKILLDCPFENTNSCELVSKRKTSGAGTVAASLAGLVVSVLVSIYTML